MIRPYQISDKEKLIEILHLNVPEYFDPKEVNDFIAYLEVKGGTYLVIELEKEIIGGLGYEIREVDRTGRINWIFLHPDYSRLGYGKEAVYYCLNILNSDPLVETLIVRTSQLAYQFFEKLGYQLIQTEKNYWAPAFDLYLMKKIKYKQSK
jgi:ribosomal protein S18 acetylase RimI-like enzyme